jgi:nucleoside phosphorylase
MPALRDLRCSLLLLVATPAEEKGLKEAARELKIQWEQVKAKESPLQIEYYDLGAIGNEVGVIALPPSRDEDDKLVMGSIGFFGSAARAVRLRVATGAQAIVQVGMAFGINPAEQKIGDVLVSTCLVPYDNRDIKPDSRKCGQCGKIVKGFAADFQYVRREPARPALVGLFGREQVRKHPFAVYPGAVLSGAARIHCGAYRDQLARAVPPGEDPIVGGEMESVGLLAASVASDDPIWCMVKGISDSADENRDAVIKEGRALACRNAGLFVLSALANDYRGD